MASIQDCLETIPHSQVLKTLQKFCQDKVLVNLVGEYLVMDENEKSPLTPFYDRSEFKKGKFPLTPLSERGGLCGAKRGLPAGMLLSGFLCELYLHQLDVFLDKKRWPFVRVGSELVIFARDEAGAKKAVARAENQLRKMGLTLEMDKTQVVRSSSRHQFLGRHLPNCESWIERLKSFDLQDVGLWGHQQWVALQTWCGEQKWVALRKPVLGFTEIKPGFWKLGNR